MKTVLAVCTLVSGLLVAAACGSHHLKARDYASVALPDGLSTDWSVQDTPLDRDADTLARDTEAHLDMARLLLEAILSVPGERTVANTFVPYNELWMHIDAANQECGLLSQVHPDETVRTAAEEGEAAASRLATELSLSVELYEALAAVSLDGVDPLTVRAVEEELEDFRRSGVDKSAEVRERITQLSDELTVLGQEWSRNISTDRREIVLTSVDRLAGLPADYVANNAPDDDGLIHIDTTYPDYVPFMTYADDAAAREQLYIEYTNRAYPQNLDVLRAVLEKRYEYANLLGYPNYAEYVTADKMVGSAGNAQAFIDKVAAACRTASERDYGMLLARKRQDQPDATSVEDWEKGYYGTKIRTEQFDFDPQEARPYFEFEAVQQGLFDLTSRMFGVRYVKVEGLDLWHDDVTAWDLYEGDELIGRFMLDLHPRPNKYNHAACFGYREGVAGRRLPISVLVCNFPNPKDSKNGVALMEHGEVQTFFHEFGHLLHALFAGHQPWIGISGIATEWDFVEAPSQMLEEWTFDYDALTLFARHYETDQVIPLELVQNLRRAAEFGKGSGTAHQTFYAALSLNYYDRPPSEVDLDALMIELRERYTPYPHVAGTHFNANFGHLYGYSAIYYTYKWSEVIAKDMYSRFEKEGALNTDTALDYRRKVLDAGGSAPAAVLVEDFLGRPYSFDAFERWLDQAPEAPPAMSPQG